MTSLENALTAVARPSADALRRLVESEQLQDALGGCLWLALIFVVIHFGN